MMRRAVSVLLWLAACKPELNPVRPPPTHEVLLAGGVWVAHNLGCAAGCEQIRRGDRIVAVDGVQVDHGAAVDASGLDRGSPVKLTIVSYGSTVAREVTISAAPHDELTPIRGAPSLFTVGAAALDRAPAWARGPLFGRVIPALGLRRTVEPHEFVTGRQLYGRAALLVLWPAPVRLAEMQAFDAAFLEVYAQVQAQREELRRAGVYPIFAAGFAVDRRVRDLPRLRDDPRSRGEAPIYQLVDEPGSDAQFGVEGSGTDLQAELFDRTFTPAVVVIDRRGIVRFHARGFPLGRGETIAAAITFARDALRDGPAG